MSRNLLTACLQTAPRPDFDSAIAGIRPLIEQAVASGARLLALPEYCGGLRSDGPLLSPPSAPERQHPVIRTVAEMASKYRVWILIGSVAVDGPGGRIYNRSLVVDDVGSITARYDKLHLFDIQLSAGQTYRESAVVEPGNRAVIARTAFGPVGMTICYDLRFPGLYRDLAMAGAEILAVPAAFIAATGKAHWHVLNRSRAIENGSFVVAPCASGPIPGGGQSYGHSLIVDPWGRILADGGEGEGVVLAEIDLDQVDATRSRIPSLTHGREYSFVSGDPEKAAG